MSIMQAIWDPPNVGHHHSPPSAHHMQMHSHHFHFPPTSLLDASASFSKKLRAVGQKLSHCADGERGAAGRGRGSSWSPDTDIRQTKYAYHIEIEVPGTTDKETLLIQWLSPSTLIVRGEIERPFVGHGKAAEGAYQWEQGDENGDGYAIGNPSKRSQDSTHEHDGSTLKENEHDSKHVPHGFTDQSSTRPKHVEEKTTDDGGELKRMITDPGEECADIPMFLLEERKTGPWQRTFALPHNIEMKALKARLEGGLLKIDIPIRDASEKPGMKIEIE
jgi:HSP20 family molecular chaperone IbpA